MNHAAWPLLSAVVIAIASGCSATTGGNTAGTSQGSQGTVELAKAGLGLSKAISLSDADMTEMGKQTVEAQDKQNRLAPTKSKHARRLQKVTANWSTVDSTKLDFKAYIKNDVNAFAVPNGSIRVYSGLMDKFTDDELCYVIAHEIGHIMLGHSKNAFKVAYTSSTARQAAAASGNGAVTALSSSELGAMADALINAQFSEAQENEADDYAIDFLLNNKLNTRGAVTGLRKLEKLFGNDRSVFSSQPSPGERAARMADRVKV